MEAPSNELVESEAARRRLVLAVDDELRSIERELHSGVQQHLVALAVQLQLVRALAESDPSAALSRLDELEHDVKGALDEAGRLARRIYAPLPEAGVIAVELRAAAAAADVDADVDVDVDVDRSLPPVVVRTVYLCWLDALHRRGSASVRPTISVCGKGGELTFEAVGAAASDTQVSRLRDRLEALGGSLSVVAEPGGAVRMCGALPLPPATS